MHQYCNVTLIGEREIHRSSAGNTSSNTALGTLDKLSIRRKITLSIYVRRNGWRMAERGKNKGVVVKYKEESEFELLYHLKCSLFQSKV